MSPSPGDTGYCPHCAKGVRFEVLRVHRTFPENSLGELPEIRLKTKSGWAMSLVIAACPLCGKPIVEGRELEHPKGGQLPSTGGMLFPRAGGRNAPSVVENEAPDIAADYLEAGLVLPVSRKASAALARRCLQLILTTKGGATGRNLSQQIDSVLGHLPSELAANVDAIRNVGNFAAHPMKSESTGTIVDVEEGEAEWLLEVLAELMDHYYVAPSRARERREALNKKLEDLGKPALKEPDADGND